MSGLLSKLRSRNVTSVGRPMDPRLKAEIDRPPAWMYPWQLGDGITTPVLGPELADIHQTRLELLEAPVRRALAAAGGNGRVLDLACNEGWFSHRVLEWGATSVIAVDIRPQVIRRAELIRAHLGVSAEQLDFRCVDVFDLDVPTLGSFDVVLCLGLIYHLENPIGALRIARTLTGGICAIETQLTKQDDPIRLGNGQSNIYEESAAGWAARVEHDWETNMLASSGGVVSLTPNRAALLQGACAAGFERLEIAEARPPHNQQYVMRDRAVLLAWPQ